MASRQALCLAFLISLIFVGCVSNKYVIVKSEFSDSTQVKEYKIDEQSLEFETISIALQISHAQYVNAKSMIEELAKKRYNEPEKDYLVNLLEGYLNYQQENYDIAYKKFQAASAIQPERILPIINNGYISLVETKKTAEAKNFFTRAIQIIDSTEYEKIFTLSDLFVSGNLNFKIYNSLCNEDRERKLFLCHYWRAEAYYESDEVEEAINDLRSCLQIDSLSYGLYMKMADYYKDSGRYQNALQLYNKCIEVNYQEKTSYIECGLIYYKLGEYEKAIDCLTKILSYQVYHDETLVQCKESIENGYKVKTFESLHCDYLLGSAKIYELKDLYMTRGRSYGKLEQYDNAISDLSKAIQYDDEYELAYYYRAYFYNYSGKKEQALADYKKVLELNPSRTEVLYSIALIYDSREEYEKALENYNLYIRSASSDKNIKYDPATDRIEKLKKYLTK